MMMRRHGKVDNHGHGIEGRMTSTEKIYGLKIRNKRVTYGSRVFR